MSAYLTAQELANMIGCEPNSYACMRRYLRKNNWPFETNLRGFPQVSRTYHDARLAGQITHQTQINESLEPDFSMFKLA